MFIKRLAVLLLPTIFTVPNSLDSGHPKDSCPTRYEGSGLERGTRQHVMQGRYQTIV